MDRIKKIALIQRSLGLRHKLKVHESLKAPDSHEELALMMLAKWELEDELRAIEEILAGARQKNIASKRGRIEKEDVALDESEGDVGVGVGQGQGKKKSKK